MIRSSLIRRILLSLAALAFFAVALGSLIAPHKMAEPFGYELTSPNALNEYRAIYVGLFLAHAVVLLWAVRRIEHAALGDVAGLLILGQAVGRIVSIAVDGIPSSDMWGMLVGEGVGGALLLLVRPSSAGTHPRGAGQASAGATD
jgi:hypothetical protein